MANFETFEHDGKTYKVRLPNSKEREEGERIFSRTFSRALQDGCLLEAQVMKVARDQGLWDENKEAEIAAIKEDLQKKEEVLDEGGIELDEAIEVVREMKSLRAQLWINQLMLAELKSQSANHKAEAARTEYFVSRCLIDEKGNQVFKNVDDYYLQQNSELANLATFNFSKIWYNYNEDSFSFPEDRFIKEFNLQDQFNPPPVKKERKPFLKDGKPISAGTAT